MTDAAVYPSYPGSTRQPARPAGGSVENKLSAKEARRRLAIWRDTSDRGEEDMATCCADANASVSWGGCGMWTWKRGASDHFLAEPTCPWCGADLRLQEAPHRERDARERQEQAEREARWKAEQEAAGAKEYPPATCCLDGREALTHREGGWEMEGESIRFCPFCGTRLP